MVNSYESNFGSAYEQALPTLGEAMVQIMQFFGAKAVYGVGGDFAANIIAALDSSLNVTPASNEMHAAFCACAQAEIEGMGFCLSTYTVGSLPCLTAAALAKTERLPVVFISGAPGENEVRHGAIHHTVHSASDWVEDYDAALRAFAGLGLRAERLQGDRNRGQPNVAAMQFLTLLTHAFVQRQPVFIEIPRDLLAAKTQPVLLPYSTDELLQQPVRLAGAEVIAETIFRKLAKATHPLVYIGEQIKLNEFLREQIASFCHSFQIPYVTSWFAKGLFDEFDPLCLGAYNGVFSAPELRQFVESKVDYVLDVGTSIFSQDSNAAFHTNTHFIEQFANKTVVKSTVAHERDLVTLFDHLLAMELTPFTFNGLPHVAPVWRSQDKMDFHNLTDVLNQLQAEDPRPYIYLPEVGNSYFASYSLRTRANASGRAWLTNPWYAAMGTSLPYARVVAETIRSWQMSARTVVLTGDGGFHFQLNELIHFQKQQLPVVIVYMRNNIFHLGQCGQGAIYHCSDAEFDVQTLVKAYGGRGMICHTVGEFMTAFRDAVTINRGIYLIEVPCDTREEFQCREIRLLNLYIRARNGIADAVAEWEKIKRLN